VNGTTFGTISTQGTDADVVFLKGIARSTVGPISIGGTDADVRELHEPSALYPSRIDEVWFEGYWTLIQQHSIGVFSFCRGQHSGIDHSTGK